MDCARLRELLVDHVDGLLGREDAEAARDHLAACGDCRALQEEVRRNFAALDAWEDEELPGGAFGRLAARLPRPAGAAPARRGWVRLGVPYAAGLATAAAAAWFLVLPRGGGPVPRDRDPAPPPVAVERTAASPLKPGEQKLLFRDAGGKVIREFLLPEGVDPGMVQLVGDEVPVVVPPGGVR
jgi:anti-sigma factor RsiW